MKKITILIITLFIFLNFQQMSAQKIVKDSVNQDGVREVEFQPSEKVCSRMIYVKVKDDIIVDAHYLGGCSGNTQGISALIKNMSVDEAIGKIEGIMCGSKGTSCPDQLAKALIAIKETNKKNN